MHVTGGQTLKCGLMRRCMFCRVLLREAGCCRVPASQGCCRACEAVSRFLSSTVSSLLIRSLALQAPEQPQAHNG